MEVQFFALMSGPLTMPVFFQMNEIHPVCRIEPGFEKCYTANAVNVR